MRANTACPVGGRALHVRHARYRPGLVATVLAAGALAMLTPVAVAEHYHNFSGSNHGFVHGGSTTDGSMHSRVEHAAFRNYYRECWVYERASPKTYEYRTAGDSTTCNLWNGSFGADPPECKWSAYLRYDFTFNGHFHFAHGYNGYCQMDRMGTVRIRYAAAMALGVIGSSVVGVAIATTASDRASMSQTALVVPVGQFETHADPEGQTPWSMRVTSANVDGQCYIYGQSRNGQIGKVDETNQFTPYPIKSAEQCPAPAQSRSVNVGVSVDFEKQRFILHGFVGTEVQKLSLRKARRTVDVVPHDNGMLFYVAKGVLDDAPIVTASFEDGTSAAVFDHQPIMPPVPKPHVGPVEG